MHNIKGLSGTLNCNKLTKNVMSKRLPYPDFKNSHVDIKLKLLMLTSKSMLTLDQNRLCQSINKIPYESI